MSYRKKRTAQSSRYGRTSPKPAAKRKGSVRKTAKTTDDFTKKQKLSYIRAVIASRKGQGEE
jgi:hypothetical protein